MAAWRIEMNLLRGLTTPGYIMMPLRGLNAN
jgi:hypothetical protein